MKKICAVLCVLLVMLSFTIPVFAEDKKGVEVKAKSSILMCTDTGDVICENNAHEKMPPASVTKIMSMLLIVEAIESGKLSVTDEVRASKNACSKGGSQIWLKENETFTVQELLKAIAVASANDACCAMAEHIAGSEEAFVAMMNKRAKELKMNDTNFENCSGLDDTAENHITTAYDIALMSKELIGHELIREYTTIWMDSLRDGATELTNTNKLIRFYEGATGLKTGTTAKAGSCLSATASRDGMSLVAVVMGCETSDDRFESAKALLNYGFSNFALYTPNINKSMLTDIKVIGGVEKMLSPGFNNISPFLIEKGSQENIKQEIKLPKEINAPVEKGQVLGEVILKDGDKKIGEMKLTSAAAIPKANFSIVFSQMISLLAS